MVSKLSLPLNKLHTVDIVGCDTALPAKSLLPMKHFLMLMLNMLILLHSEFE